MGDRAVSTLRAYTTATQRLPRKPASVPIGPHNHKAVLVPHHNAIGLVLLMLFLRKYVQNLTRHQTPPYERSNITHALPPFSCSLAGQEHRKTTPLTQHALNHDPTSFASIRVFTMKSSTPVPPRDPLEAVRHPLVNTSGKSAGAMPHPESITEIAISPSYRAAFRVILELE